MWWRKETGMSNVFLIFLFTIARQQSSIPRSEPVNMRPVRLNSNISDRSEANGTVILSDLLLDERSEFSGKSAI